MFLVKPKTNNGWSFQKWISFGNIFQGPDWFCTCDPVKNSCFLENVSIFHPNLFFGDFTKVAANTTITKTLKNSYARKDFPLPTGAIDLSKLNNDRKSYQFQTFVPLHKNFLSTFLEWLYFSESLEPRLLTVNDNLLPEFFINFDWIFSRINFNPQVCYESK